MHIDKITAVTPMQGRVNFQKTTHEDVLTDKPYRQVTGCLIYLTVCTRPDIAFAVPVLFKFLNSPSDQHWKAAM